MRLFMMFTAAYICLAGIQGCSTTTPDYNMPRQIIASPAERISADSGEMHGAMSGSY